MSGYTPLFGSLTTGTLCGKWPDIGLWPIVLSMTDRHGIVDVTPAYIAGVTGLPVAEVIACMARFCEPDPYSRSPTDNGARLRLIDEHRDWGWQVVNHGMYREKARKQSYDAERVASGRDAERKRQQRAGSPDEPVPTCPAPSRALPLSDSDSDSDSDSEKDTTAADAANFDRFKAAYPQRAGSQPWTRALRAINARLREGSTWNEITEGAERYARFIEATGKSRTEFVMQACAFCGPERHYREPWHLPATKADIRLTANLSAAQEFLRRTDATQ